MTTYIFAASRRTLSRTASTSDPVQTVADYTQLPPMSIDYEPDWDTYVSEVKNAAAGTSRLDPISGVRIWKLTDATMFPASGGVRMDYSNGGPLMSQPWGADGESVTVWSFLMGLCDVTRGAGPTNYRTPVVAGGELRFGFSRNPATPHRAYVMNTDGYLYRINTQTNTQDDGAGFPYDLRAYAGAYFPLWLTISENDATIAMIASDSSYAIAVRTGPQTVMTKSLAQINAANGDRGLNECYTNATGRYVLVMSNDDSGHTVWDLDTNLLSGPFEMTGQLKQMSHASTMGGTRFVATDPYGSRLTAAIIDVGPVTSAGQAFPTLTHVMPRSDTSIGFQHNNSYQVGTLTDDVRHVVGQTDFGSDMIANSGIRSSFTVHSGNIYKATLTGGGYGIDLRGIRHVFRRATASSSAAIVHTVRRASSVVDMTEDSWFYDLATSTFYIWQLSGGSPDVRYVSILPSMPSYGAWAAFSADGETQRFIAHQYSSRADYNSAAFIQQSQDGKWCLASSDHGVPEGRNDLFAIEIPTVSV